MATMTAVDRNRGTKPTHLNIAIAGQLSVSAIAGQLSVSVIAWGRTEFLT